MTAELSQDLRNEVVDPGSSRDYFDLQLDDRTIRVNVTAFKLQYQIRMTQLIQPVIKSLALSQVGSGTFKDMEVADYLKAVSTAMEHVHVLRDLLIILIHNSSKEYKDIKPEDLDDAVIPFGSLQKCIFAAFERSGAVNEQVANFFKAVALRGNDILIELTRAVNEAGNTKTDQSPSSITTTA